MEVVIFIGLYLHFQSQSETVQPSQTLQVAGCLCRAGNLELCRACRCAMEGAWNNLGPQMIGGIMVYPGMEIQAPMWIYNWFMAKLDI